MNVYGAILETPIRIQYTSLTQPGYRTNLRTLSQIFSLFTKFYKNSQNVLLYYIYVYNHVNQRYEQLINNIYTTVIKFSPLYQLYYIFRISFLNQ